MRGSVQGMGLAALFERAARTSKRALTEHIESAAPDRRFQQQTLFAVAALEGAVGRGQLDVEDIRLVRQAASDAAALCRTQPPDRALARAVACLEGVVAACDQGLGERLEAATPWTRFLFVDADIEAQRLERRWRVRTGGMITERNVLDLALEDALGFRPARTAELAVAILDWFERGLMHDGAASPCPADR